MNITNIENMTFAQLNEQREAVAAALNEVAREELQTRYLQARMDAKLRDEKLAEQGATITSLNAALADARANAAQQAERADKNAAAMAACEAALAQQRSLNAALEAENKKISKLATERRTVLAKLMQEIAPLLAAE